MKKMISLALCLTMALAFAAGCKKKEEVKPVEAPAAAPAAPVQGQATSKQAPAAPAAPAEKAPEAPAKH
ncbi:MAG TPA: hypothetical protein VFF53_05465 [Geobacteraceae bacterium]|nr:hypothetical protein [Geobacteraceae bacterium]